MFDPIITSGFDSRNTRDLSSPDYLIQPGASNNAPLSSVTSSYPAPRLALHDPILEALKDARLPR
jgi:hypothetical protein